MSADKPSEFDMAQPYDPALYELQIQDPALMPEEMLPPTGYPPIEDPFAPDDPIPLAPSIPPPVDLPPGMPLPPEFLPTEKETPPPSLWQMRQAWEERDIYFAIIEEFIQLFFDKHPINTFQIRHHRNFRPVYEALRAIKIVPAQEPEYRFLATTAAEIAAFLPTLKPLQDEQRRYLDERAPLVRESQALQTANKELRASISTYEAGLSVNQRFIDKYGHPSQMPAVLVSNMEHLEILQKALNAVNAKIDDAGRRISEKYNTFFEERPDENEIDERFKQLVIDYSHENPESVMRGLQDQLIDEALRRDKAVAELVARRRADAAREKEDYLKFYKTKANHYLNQGNLEQNYQIALHQVKQRSLFMVAGQEILKELKSKYEAEAAALDREAKAMEDIGVTEALTQQAAIKKRGIALSERAKRLEYALDRFKRKTEVFAAQAARVKSEITPFVGHFETMRDAYDERTKYVYSDDFKRRMLHEFKSYLRWKKERRGLKDAFWINYYETGAPSRFSGEGPMGSEILRRLVEYLYTSDYGTASVEWPIAGANFVDLNEKPEERVRKNEKYEELIRRIPFSTPTVVPPIVRVDTLLDFYLAPGKFQQKIEEGARAMGWQKADVKPDTWDIQIEHMRYDEKLRRVEFIMKRVEKALLERLGVAPVNLDDKTPEQRLALFQRARNFVNAVSHLMPVVRTEMEKVRTKILDFTATNTERLAYIEALRLIRRFAYWTNVLNRTADEGERLERAEVIENATT